MKRKRKDYPCSDIIYIRSAVPKEMLLELGDEGGFEAPMGVS